MDSSLPAKHGNEHGGVKPASLMAGQSAKMVPVLRGEISNTQSRPLNGHPPTSILLSTIGAASSKFDEFLAKRSQFDIDHDQIWQAYADRSGNGSYLKKMAQ